MNFIRRKAERRQAKLRLALCGVSGSGKTTGALKIAKGMGGKKIVLIDTERRSADLFSHIVDFDHIEMTPPYTPESYIEVINECGRSGDDIIIIDSLSHAWAGEGGALDMHTRVTNASASKNSYTAWAEVTPWHNRLIDSILQSPAHVISTIRLKTHYEMIDMNGKKKPVKMGLAPIQREGIDYEFTVVLDIDHESHVYSASKDRTELFAGKPDKISVDTGKKLIDWLNEGKSCDDIERDDIEKIRTVMMSSTLDELRRQYSDARKLYPHREAELLKIAEERKLALSLANQDGGMH